MNPPYPSSHSSPLLIQMARVPKMEGEDQEALFSSYPCTALYYVQSPSTASHTNSNISVTTTTTTLISPDINANQRNGNQEASRLALSRYSSSRGSNSFPRDKKKATSSYDLQSNDGSILKSGRLRIVDARGVEYAGTDVDDVRRRSGLWRFVAVDHSSSCFCLSFQILWRFLMSLGVALFVFFLVTKPPPPNIYFKAVGFKQFSLQEGLDNTGVVTKILSSNCSVDMEIDNNSKVFGLHVHSPTLEIDFGHLKLATSQGPESYVESDSYYVLRTYVVVKNSPVYGAGRSMEDMLESGQGLPLMIRMRSRSSYRVVSNLIRLRYNHHEECQLVIDSGYDEQHNIKIHNSTCITKTHHT